MTPAQRAVPMLSYEDVGAAVDWLERAFGFHESGRRFTDETGRVTHAEIELEDGTVMLGWPGTSYRSPRRHAERCDVAKAIAKSPYVVDGVLVYVTDVRGHLEHARARGATILGDLEEEPFGSLYRAEDVEGHRWMFLQPA
jgi:PhnB protein